MRTLTTVLFALVLAGCATAVAVRKPDISAKSAPPAETCEKPGYWAAESGQWICKQPKVIQVDPGYGSSFYFRSGPGFGFCRGYYVGTWGPYC